MPGGNLFCYGLFHGDDQIGFQCFANYVPRERDKRMIYHSNRTVIHPDFQGFGLGIKFVNACTKHFVDKFGYEIRAKGSHSAMFYSRINDENWELLRVRRTFGSIKKNHDFGALNRRTAYREYGIKTYHFRYVGHDKKLFNIKH